MSVYHVIFKRNGRLVSSFIEAQGPLSAWLLVSKSYPGECLVLVGVHSRVYGCIRWG